MKVVRMISFSKAPNSTLRYFDIAANLADGQFKGKYFGKQYHDEDLDGVFSRAETTGVDKMLIVGGYLEDTDDCEKLINSRSDNSGLWTTVGVHPCRANVWQYDIPN